MTDEHRPRTGTETAATARRAPEATADRRSQPKRQAQPDGRDHATSARARSTSRSPSTASDIDNRLNEKFSELVTDAACPASGPARRRASSSSADSTRKSSDQVKAEVLLASLEQLADDHDVAPLSAARHRSAPRSTFPKEGPLVYEFDVEVRPAVRPAQLQGPQAQTAGQDLHRRRRGRRRKRRLLAPYGQVVPKPEGNARARRHRHRRRRRSATATDVIGEIKEVQLRVEDAAGLQGRRGRALRRAGRAPSPATRASWTSTLSDAVGRRDAARQDRPGDVRRQGRQDAAVAGADARVPAQLRRPLARSSSAS